MIKGILTISLLLLTGCVSLPVDGPYDQLTGEVKLHSQKPIKTITVDCINRGDPLWDVCKKIMPLLKEELALNGYEINSLNPNLKLRLLTQYECKATEHAPYFLGIISMYGIGYTPSVCGFNIKSLYEIENQKADKRYCLYSTKNWDDPDLTKKLIGAIKEDIDWIWITNK